MAGQVRTGGTGYYVDYDVNGKVTAIYSDAAKTVKRVSFGYDESGIRIRKTDHILNTITYYVNDASGNLLAIYDNKGTTMQQKELPVYAASRVGVYNRSGDSYQYELTDHLGNVRVVINGTKLANGQADVVYYSDYYPYGSPLTLAANDYRYGYQGQYAEVDKETGWNNFDLRMYDPAIGRWMSTDPYGQYDSPYVGMGNNPVSSVDPDGGWDGDPEKPINDNNPHQLKGVEIKANRMTPDERMASRTARGLTGDDLFKFSNGKEDWAARNRIESYGQYRKTMSEQPQFDAWVANAFIYGSGGEFIELPGAIYGLGRIAFTKLRARGIITGGEIIAKQVSVIGPRATYREFAKKIGANFLDVTDEAWTMRKNVGFLQGVVKRGDDVIFSGTFDPSKLKVGSVLSQEIRYLTRQGYSWADDFSRLIKK